MFKSVLRMEGTDAPEGQEGMEVSVTLPGEWLYGCTWSDGQGLAFCLEATQVEKEDFAELFKLPKARRNP